MEEKELLKIANSYFSQPVNERVNELFATEDGTVFYTKNSACLHAKQVRGHSEYVHKIERYSQKVSRVPRVQNERKSNIKYSDL